MRNNDPFADLLRSLEENLQGEGGSWVPPDDRRPRGQRGNSRRIVWLLIPLLLLILFNRLITFYSDYLWYESVGFEAIFSTRLWAAFALFGGIALILWLFLAINVLIMRRLEPTGVRGTPLEIIADIAGLGPTSAVLLGGAVIALFMGLSASGRWEQVLLYLNQQPYGIQDPLFSRDISFYLFTLPIWEIARSWLIFAVAVTLVATAVVSGIIWRGWRARRPVLAHFAVLGALLLLLFAWQYRLDALQLVYSNRGAVFGAGYADVRAQLPAYNILTVVTLVAAVLLVVAVFLRQAWRAIVAVVGVWLIVTVVAGNFYPGLVQRFQVTPNELTLEGPYIADNIEFTRLAYRLDDVEVQAYDVETELAASELLAETETVQNIRLWDYRPLLQTYNQIQALRQYYAFNDVDVDRYEVDGRIQQVMLAARELVPERLSEQAQTWVNRRLVYTHGYGVAMSPVAQVTRDGLPTFILQDIPPQGAITVTQPQIYFGELTDEYVIARTEEPEFDYPSGSGFETTSFAADTGIDMGFWARLLFAIRFGDINMLLNQDISSESQLLWQRDIAVRVREVAPFLTYDSDPYIVVGDGGLYWIIDAYTVSNRFPYSAPTTVTFGDINYTINYIRNAVKVVINAYDGTMRFYLVDAEEPIAAAYARIFPTLFIPMSEMPADLLRHVRYPEDLFTVQADVYRLYHMTSVNEFYNREDVWAWPQELFDNQTQPLEPYYVLMQLPGSEALEYVQILPFTPANRENMIAWMAARSDPESYGSRIVYEFGNDELFFGPQQIEARINQDPEISAQLALWNQQGSSVIRGNLLVIPVAGSLLYVEPLYLQSATGRIPELQRVIVATVDQVIMAENLGLALAELFGREVLNDKQLASLASFGDESAAIPPTVGVAGEEGSEATLATVEELIVQASAQFERAQEHAQTGNWAGYGEEIAALEATLASLAELTGVALPEPVATPAPEDAAPPADTPATAPDAADNAEGNVDGSAGD